MDLKSRFDMITEETIKEFVNSQEQEDLQLEFKTINDASFNFNDDKRNLARALSGFANSSGGIIVWGVGTSKVDGVDCASELKPISNIALLESRLNNLTGKAAMPIIDGVLHRTIDQGGNSGYAMTFVPESDRGPHMAELGEHRFYKRSGDSFYRMEQFDIADMFGRRGKPELVVYYRIDRRSRDLSICLGLRNEGRATARSPCFAFIAPRGRFRRCRYGIDGNGNEGMTHLRSKHPEFDHAYGGVEYVIHPGMSHDIARLTQGTPPRTLPLEDVVVKYMLACENQPVERDELRVPVEELRDSSS